MRFREALTVAVIVFALVAPALGASSQNANKSQQVTVQPAVTRPVQPKQPAERFQPVTKLGVMSRPAREAKERFEYVKNTKELMAKFKAGDEQAGIKLAALHAAWRKEQQMKKDAKELRSIQGAVTGSNSPYGKPSTYGGPTRTPGGNADWSNAGHGKPKVLYKPVSSLGVKPSVTTTQQNLYKPVQSLGVKPSVPAQPPKR